MRIPRVPSRCTFSVWFLFIAMIALATPGAQAQAPVITAPPLTKLVVAGQPVSFSVTATGANLTYQWKRTGQSIPGATGSTYQIASAALDDRGWYQVVVSGSAGSVSSTFHLHVGFSSAKIVSWGSAYAPADLGSVVALTSCGGEAVALRSDGSLISWSLFGPQATINNPVPAGLGNVVAVAGNSTYILALKADGTVVAWSTSGLLTNFVPTNLTKVVAISVGGHSLALKSDGTVVAWGDAYNGQINVPANLSGVVAVAAGGGHSLALTAAGQVVAWGGTNYNYGATAVPLFASEPVAVAAGSQHSLALLRDGAVAAWGSNSYQQSTVPVGLKDVVSLASGPPESSNAVIRADGTIVVWGYNAGSNLQVPRTLPFAAAVLMPVGMALVSAGDLAVTTPPTSRLVNAGSTVTLSVAATGSAPLTYLWKKNDALIAEGGAYAGT